MNNKLNSYTTSYKFFYNNNVCFLTSAKLGTRFFKNFITNDEWQTHSYPLNIPFEMLEYEDTDNWKPDEVSYYQYLKDIIFPKSKEIIVLIRNPIDRFISGVCTLLDIFHLRFFKYGEDGLTFMRSNFQTDITDEELMIGIQIFKNNLYDVYENGNIESLKQIIFNNIVSETIYKDAHIEYHHTLLYSFMNKIKNDGFVIKQMDLLDLDYYIQTKTTTINQNDEIYIASKNSNKKSIPYNMLKNNIEAWKNENNNLSLYLDTESIYYQKIKLEYEVLL
jgi:hypothetical protein